VELVAIDFQCKEHMKIGFLFACIGLCVAVEGLETISEASGAVHVSAAQVCSIDGSFAELKTRRMTLGFPQEERSVGGLQQTIALPRPGMHAEHYNDFSSNINRFDSFKGYALEAATDAAREFWTVIDAQNQKKHADEIAEAKKRRR